MVQVPVVLLLSVWNPVQMVLSPMTVLEKNHDAHDPSGDSDNLVVQLLIIVILIASLKDENVHVDKDESDWKSYFTFWLDFDQKHIFIFDKFKLTVASIIFRLRVASIIFRLRVASILVDFRHYSEKV